MVKIELGQLEQSYNVQVVTENGMIDSEMDSVTENYISIKADKLLNIVEGDTVEFYCSVCDRCYRLQSQAIKVIQSGNSSILELTLPIVVGTIQRRQYFRLPVEISVRFMRIKDTEFKIPEEHENICNMNLESATTLDISGGGISILTTEELKEGSYVFIELDMNYSIRCICKVLNCRENRSNNYCCSLQYVNLSASTRDNILNYIFNQTWAKSKNEVTLMDLLEE